MALGERQRAASATTFKLCSLLLSYPDAELLDARAELSDEARALSSTTAGARLQRFCAWWCDEDPLLLQQHYVQTFDLEKRCGLYLTFYGEGDKRERGVALLRLKRLYRAAGLPLQGSELPDYLPVMLEFAAAAPAGRGTIVLREHRAALELVRLSLRERETPYAEVLDAVCLTLGHPSAADRARAFKLAASGPPTELVGLEPFAPPEVMPHTGARRSRTTHAADLQASQDGERRR
jgi:nitrate reductase molybdenum cofactor assembly chaperone NarJ/NarW